MPDTITAEPEQYQHKWLVLFTTSLALFVILLDATVVNISVPSFIKELHATLAQAEWVLNAYTLTFAALLITFGRLGDMFGHRRMFILGMSIFGFGSLLCGLTPSANALIAFRVIQASGSAFMLPATLSITTVSFPAEERGRALGVWGAVSGVALGVGPALGGFLTQFNWRYIFFINLPVVLFAIPLTALVIGVRKPTQRHRIDWLGVALTIGGLTALNYGMIEGPVMGWASPVIVGLLVTAAVLFAAFIWWEGRAAEPLMRLDLFRDPTFTFGNISASLLLFTMLGLFFLMPLFLQTQLHYSALQTGLSLLPLSLALMVAAPISGWLSDVVGSRWLASAGLLLTAIGVFWLSFLTRETTTAQLAPRYVLAGLGMGMVLAPVTAAVMSEAPPGLEGAVAGVLATMRQVGAVLGVAVLGAVLQAQLKRDVPLAAGVAGVSPAVAAQNAFVAALGYTLRVAAFVALLGAASALFIAPGNANDAGGAPSA
jgi:EmrB/QacA subfamily drug resistance transporter